MIYVLIDGKYHVQVEDPASLAASSACGIPVPFGAEWTRHAPAKVCGKCVSPKRAA